MEGRMKHGYARCSSEGQDYAIQVAELQTAGCEKVWAEKVTGASRDRKALNAMLAALAPGDTVLVTALDRLGRDARDILNIVHEIGQAGVGFFAKKEGMDTTTDIGKFVLTIFAGMAEMERKRILERTAIGRATARQAGVKFGRPSVLTEYQQQEARARRETGESLASIARSYGTSHSTISRLGK
jgi:DNA invertase Pin-like site-specific DNA recombinase